MHRLTRTLTVVSLAGLLAVAALPAQARSTRSEHRGGKKAVGEVVSFDATTSALVVALSGGDELTANVDPDVQVKLDHRGHANKERERAHGNPTRGSVDDLVAGTPVLRLKLEEGVVTKIRLRPLPVETPAVPEGEEREEVPAPDDGSAEGDFAEPDEDGDEEEDSDDDEPEDDDRGDQEDALPPLP